MKFRLIIVVIFSPLVLFAQKTFVINGSVRGIPENTTVELRNDDLSKQPLATAVSKQGNFILKGSVADPNIFLLTYQGNSKKLVLFLDNSVITVKGIADSLEYAKVSGSPSHAVFNKFNDEFNPLFDKLSKLVNSINSGQSDPGGTMRKEYENTIQNIQQKTDRFVTENPGSPVTPFVVMVITQLNTDVMVTEKRFQALSPEVKNGYYGKMLSQNIIEGKIGAVGTDAIEFVQNDTSGHPVSLSSFRGKYLLVDFWASWCGPCRRENPKVVEAFNQYKDKNFTILGVSLDKSKDPWVKAIQDDRLTWTHVSDLKYFNNEVAVKYRIDKIPQNFLIDPNGKIIAKNLSGEELIRKLKEVLN